LERIKDANVTRLVEKIGEHYQVNISNRFLRPLILQLQLDKNTWDQIEILTEKIELYRFQGFHLDDLYRQIAACARLAEAARHGIVPSLKAKLSAIPTGHDKILRDMAANNFASNLHVFANLLKELYFFLVELDKKDAGKRPALYTQMPELHIIDHLD